MLDQSDDLVVKSVSNEAKALVRQLGEAESESAALKLLSEFSIENYEDAMNIANRTFAMGLISCSLMALDKINGLRNPGAILSLAGFTAQEHALRYKLAKHSKDTLAEAGLTVLRAPPLNAFNHLPDVTLDLALEATRHSKMEIPKTIHQIWIGTRAPPTEPQEEWRRWCEKYGYEYRLWTEAECAELSSFSTEHCQYFYKKKGYAGAADILRAEILLLHGGLYVDMDMFPIDTGYPLHDMLSLAGMVCMTSKSFRQLNSGGLYVTNAVLGCTQGNPVMRRYSEGMAESWRRMPNETAWWNVGGCLLTVSLFGTVNTIAPDNVGSLGKSTFEDRVEVMAKIRLRRPLVLFSAKPWR